MNTKQTDSRDHQVGKVEGCFHPALPSLSAGGHQRQRSQTMISISPRAVINRNALTLRQKKILLISFEPFCTKSARFFVASTDLEKRLELSNDMAGNILGI